MDHNFQLHCHQMEHFTHGKLIEYNCYIFNNMTFCLIIRGKGDYFRLGHGTNDHVRKPKPVSGLQGKKIVQFATGL